MKKYLFLCICLFIAALNFNILLHPYSLVTGGTQGVALLLDKITSIKPSYIILVINILALVLSYFFLTKDVVNSSLVSSFLYPLFVRLTSGINIELELNIIVVAIIAGLMCGLTGGFIYYIDFSSGGITVLSSLAKKYLKIKISISTFIINSLIILLGMFYFGIKNALYSILVILLGSIVIYILLKKKRLDYSNPYADEL